MNGQVKKGSMMGMKLAVCTSYTFKDNLHVEDADTNRR